MSRKRRKDWNRSPSHKAQKSLAATKQLAHTVAATVLHNTDTHKITIPAVCNGQTICELVETVVNEPVGCVEAYMIDDTEEISCRVWYADDYFQAQGQVFLQIPMEMRQVTFTLVTPQDEHTVECQRCEIAYILDDMGVTHTFVDQDEPIPLDELQFMQTLDRVYT